MCERRDVERRALDGRRQVAEAEGRTLTLPELQAFVARLSDYYHAHGYPLARAIVPAQTISSGTVRIDII